MLTPYKFFLHFFSSAVQATVCFHLEQTTLGVESQPQNLPWTYPYCYTLQYIGNFMQGNTAEEVFEKGEKTIQIILKASFVIKQNQVADLPRKFSF